MKKGQSHVGHTTEVGVLNKRPISTNMDDFVLEKSIFNNVFEKDIRRVFIYKKAERLAKAIHLIAPAFADSASLRSRIESIGIGLVNAAILPSGTARSALSRELLALSSVLSIARTGGLLSNMNADLISREAHILLQEVAEYEEPRLFLDESPTLSDIAKQVQKEQAPRQFARAPRKGLPAGRDKVSDKGHVKDTRSDTSSPTQERRDAILSVIKNKQKASIKDISTLIRNVSEKTIQRELISLIALGIVIKEGERRWSVYSLA